MLPKTGCELRRCHLSRPVLSRPSSTPSPLAKSYGSIMKTEGHAELQCDHPHGGGRGMEGKEMKAQGKEARAHVGSWRPILLLFVFKGGPFGNSAADHVQVVAALVEGHLDRNTYNGAEDWRHRRISRRSPSRLSRPFSLSSHPSLSQPFSFFNHGTRHYRD